MLDKEVRELIKNMYDKGVADGADTIRARNKKLTKQNEDLKKQIRLLLERLDNFQHNINYWAPTPETQEANAHMSEYKIEMLTMLERYSQDPDKFEFQTGE